MEPIPESQDAVVELDPLRIQDDLLPELVDRSNRVREVVPACVGMSVALLEHGVTLTLVATSKDIAALDAVQYLDGGPCVRAAKDNLVVAVDEAGMDEAGWLMFARATAADGIESTLSLPLLEEGRVVGSVNLYGATESCFDGHHDELADILQAWAGGAVTNADLGFHSRDTARLAPRVLRDAVTLDAATGLLAAMNGTDVDEAGEALVRAASQAGLTPPRLAAALMRLLAGSAE